MMCPAGDSGIERGADDMACPTCGGTVRAGALVCKHCECDLRVLRSDDAPDAAIHSALHDPLTGLPGQRLLLDRLESAVKLARREGGVVVVASIDVKAPKTAEDGDRDTQENRAVRAVAEQLKRAVREVDTVARMPQGHFLVVAHTLDRSSAKHVIGKLDDCLHPDRLVGQHPLALDVTLGIAVFPDDAETADELVARAVAEMHASRSIGG
jgi:diguanylate cyclase (GGDEF)-like protein